ncbi:unnamed protein product [Rotaria socialis]|uniref:Uncharacterized protein n=1 Tax=Rotaria socialis TaxID=392032 RepID=A0A820ZID4_9BILA|nr:unnamed protein product [Rotaria socialis]CAF4563234.1 unnamed protein product [Rotaria socialis]
MGRNNRLRQRSDKFIGGASTVTLTTAEVSPHAHGKCMLWASARTHNIVDPGHNHGGSTGPFAYSRRSFGFSQAHGGFTNDQGIHTHTQSTPTTQELLFKSEERIITKYQEKQA